MTTLSNLSATPTTTPTPLIRGARAAVHCEPEQGLFIHAVLTHDGLFLYHGSEGVHLPLTALISLARQHAPNLLPAAKPAN